MKAALDVISRMARSKTIGKKLVVLLVLTEEEYTAGVFRKCSFRSPDISEFNHSVAAY